MRDIALRSIKGKIYERFDENFNEWYFCFDDVNTR